MSEIKDLIDEYLTGPTHLRSAISGMSDEDIDAAPVPGKWSTRQVICHLADFETIYIDRMTRTIAEDQPTIFDGDPVRFAQSLAYERREIEEELQFIDFARRPMARILRALPPMEFRKQAFHSAKGVMTLTTLLQRITAHIPHHLAFVEQKQRVLRGED